MSCCLTVHPSIHPLVHSLIHPSTHLQVKYAHGLHVVADALVSECKGRVWDLIVCPGGLPGADNLAACSDLLELLEEQRRSGRYYAAICASPLIVFERHGLLAGKKGTAYPGFDRELSNNCDERVVVDGNCVTSKGPGSTFEFALKLVELLFGASVEKKVHDSLILPF